MELIKYSMTILTLNNSYIWVLRSAQEVAYFLNVNNF